LPLPCNVCIGSVIVTWSTRYWYDSQTVTGISFCTLMSKQRADTLDAELPSSLA